MPITKKQYQCPTCGHKQGIETNHYGEVYSGCKSCKGMVMYCIEPEAIAHRESRPTLKTKIFTYRFNIENPDEHKAWLELKKNMVVPVFSVIAEGHDYTEHIHAMNGKEITLYVDSIFDNQWVSDIGRVMDWKEWIFPNRKIKKGYWLELTDEMIELREAHEVCGYCGTIMKKGEICTKHPGEDECAKYGMKSLATRRKK